MPNHLIAAVVLASLIPSGALAQQRDTPQPQTPPGTGRISGTIVGSESGRPVRFATVTLLSTVGEFETLTDDAGAFVFRNLPAGSFTLAAAKDGFMGTEYGQARPGTSTAGTRIRLEPRQQIDRLVFRLGQGGSISGTVRDDRGDPLYGATVTISRWTMRNGKRVLETVGAKETDERGMYRVSLLPSRQYVVGVRPSDNTVSDIERKREQGFAPAFHPNAISTAGATTIALGVDEHRTSVDVVAPLIRLTKVTGIVLDPEGKPAERVEVTLQDSRLDGTRQSTSTGRDGRFEFERVAAGAYVIQAGTSLLHQFAVTYKDANWVMAEVGKSLKAELVSVDVSLSRHIDTREASDDAKLSGSAIEEIHVTGDRMADVVLRLDPPRVVAGRVLFEGAKPPETFAKLGVALVAADDSGQLEVDVKDDGTFAIESVPPGKYLWRMKAPHPWHLASAISGGLDTLDLPLEVPRGRDLRDVTLTLRNRPTELSGVVTDAAGGAVDNRTVVVFPTDERLWSAGEPRLQSARLQPDGRFDFTGLRPGDYRIAVVGDVEENEWLDPGFLRQLVGMSVPVTLGEGEKKTQDLRVK